MESIRKLIKDNPPKKYEISEVYLDYIFSR